MFGANARRSEPFRPVAPILKIGTQVPANWQQNCYARMAWRNNRRVPREGNPDILVGPYGRNSRLRTELS